MARRKATRRKRQEPMTKTAWLKLGLIAFLLWLAGILGPVAAFIAAVQRDAILRAWETRSAIYIGIAIIVVATTSLGVWLKRLAQRV
jgi:O-antigen ligase